MMSGEDMVPNKLHAIRRQRIEEALRESEERYRNLFEGANDAIIIIRDDSCIKCNKKALLMFQCSADELVGRTPMEFSPSLQPDGVDSGTKGREKMTLALAGIPQTFEWRHRRPDGTLFDAEVSLNRTEYRGNVELQAILRDITARKRMEEALRESEEKFAKAFRATPTVLVIATFKEGRYIEVNETFERIMGYRRDEVIGRISIELNIWENPDDRARIVRMIREKGEVRDLEVNFRSREGKVYLALYSGELISVRGELCLLSLVNDVTVRKRMQEEIEILNTDLASNAVELETANRELEAFNYSVSHDLRSPLTGINGYSLIILEMCAGRLDEQCLGYVREIYAAGQRMEELITVLLDFSRLSRGEIVRESVDLTVIAQMVASRLRMQEPQRRVIFTIAVGVTVAGDAKLLQLVLENLLGNAWKYTGKQAEARIEFGVTEIDGLPAYFVRDNGAGFAMADAGRLFTPFTRLHRSNEFEGHGIGLATVQRVIQRHGGRVWAVAEVGKGATFYFTLG